MRKKWIVGILIVVMTVSLGMAGCSKMPEQNEDNGNIAGTDGIIKEVKDEYYMLSISDYDADINEILTHLIDDYDTYKDKIQMVEEKVETSDARWQTQYQYTLETGGPAYIWEMYNPDHMFKLHWRKHGDGVIDNSATSVSVTDIEGAKKIAMDVAELFETELEFYEEEIVQYYDINNQPAEEVAIYDFRQTYDDVPLAYAAFINSGKQTLYGPEFCVVVDGNGLCQISTYALVEMGEPIQTYHSREFISLEEVKRKIENYCASFNANIGNEGYKMQATIEECEIVYIPYLEKNEDVLIPAYELVVIEDDGKDVWKVHYIVDVFTGYVYYRAGFEQIS